ncbi:MAG: hypothetical protein ACRBK7_30955 [Acidimicrobiales bacterium]
MANKAGLGVRRNRLLIIVVLAALLAAVAGPAASADQRDRFDDYTWTEVNDEAPWGSRAGLEAVPLRGDFYILGGRTPNPWVAPPDGPIPGDSTIWGDVWRSRDRGQTWKRILETDDENHWPARAYHEVVTKGGRMFVLGGQNFGLEPNPACQFDPDCFPAFLSTSEFFNDVWTSRNGRHWRQLTAEAPWAGRAGLSAIVFRGQIYVMGGSFNDDPDVIGGPPTRVLFNDVWTSRNGRDWTLATDDAPWAPRAGADLLVKGGYLYLLGGEFGFAGFPPPYFNDVWRTRDGRNWELVTESAGWSPRPGHTCDVLRRTMVCFGGFGQSTDPSDPFRPSNPMDIWTSRDGKSWDQVAGAPWNAVSPAEVKYDYDTIVAPSGRDGRGRAIYTFGGDRETFDFFDPLQWLNVDDEVWRFSLPRRTVKPHR